MANEQRFDFASLGVELKLPAQAKRGRGVTLPVGDMKDMVDPSGGFIPGRLVANIAIEEEGRPGVYLELFDPPLELRVLYTADDEQRAKNKGKLLELAYWMNGRWHRFTKAKHGFVLQPNKQGDGGYGVVQIKRWGDPTIAWGP